MQLGRYCKACALGLLVLILIYSAFGYVLVYLHAGQIAGEMRLLAAYGLPPLIAPDDYYLASPWARLGSASLFGLTLGPLAAVVLSLWAYPAWRRGRLNLADGALGLVLAGMLAYLSHTAEIFWLAPLCAASAMGLFWLSVRRVPAGESAAGPERKTLVVMIGLVLLPPVLLGATSYFAVRDAMLMNPLLVGLNRFYYEHTLLAADVIKPAIERSQLVVAVHGRPAHIARRIPGSLTLLTLASAEVSAARVRLDQGRSLNAQRVYDLGGAVLKFSAEHDYNRRLRQGIGLGLMSLKVVALVLAVWLGWGLACLWRANRATALVLVLIYYALFWPLAQTAAYGLALKHDPDKLPAYAASASEPQRYVAASNPGLNRAELARLIRDASPRVRLTALVNAGERREVSLLPLVLSALSDPQFNVRTKACWALGRLADRSALGPLYAKAAGDPSWYVRDYAWAALNRIQPVARIVRLDHD